MDLLYDLWFVILYFWFFFGFCFFFGFSRSIDSITPPLLLKKNERTKAGI